MLATSKNYKEALQLYDKAIEVHPQDATLFGNRSMCHLSMSHYQAALNDAERCIELDASYAKGYFRKAMALMALGKNDEALGAFRENLKLAPSDKAVLAQIAKLESICGVSKAAEETAVPAARSTVATSSPASSSSSAKATKSEPMDVEEKEQPSSDSSMRGYKLTSDGRKTSYFTKEIDEQTKALIGDIRPKKLEESASAVTATPAVPNGGSVWNSAGTFEERTVTPWAKEYLEKAYGTCVMSSFTTVTLIDSVVGHTHPGDSIEIPIRLGRCVRVRHQSEESGGRRTNIVQQRKEEILI